MAAAAAIKANPGTADLNVADTAARRASRKAAWRLIPFVILCFVVAFLDRVNIGLRPSP